LASLGAVLTLPGIAGIVLTMGTAVDAIIYERAKEELRDGKSLDEAVRLHTVGQERCDLLLMQTLLTF
jgi:SecD/SecF fusion protein